MKNIAKVYIGVDISKNNLDIYMYPIGKSFKILTQKLAIKKIIKELAHYKLHKLPAKQQVAMKNYLLNYYKKNRLFIFGSLIQEG